MKTNNDWIKKGDYITIPSGKFRGIDGIVTKVGKKTITVKPEGVLRRVEIRREEL